MAVLLRQRNAILSRKSPQIGEGSDDRQFELLPGDWYAIVQLILNCLCTHLQERHSPPSVSECQTLTERQHPQEKYPHPRDEHVHLVLDCNRFTLAWNQRPYRCHPPLSRGKINASRSPEAPVNKEEAKKKMTAPKRRPNTVAGRTTLMHRK